MSATRDDRWTVRLQGSGNLVDWSDPGAGTCFTIAEEAGTRALSVKIEEDASPS